MRRSACFVLTATLAVLGGNFPAHAESYCVACYGPDAVYRCVIAGAPEAAAPDPRNQMQCIKQLAKSGGHARCSVERFSSAGCDGPERIISSAASPVPLTPQQQSIEGSAKGPIGPPAPASASEPAAPGAATAPPRTVEELAKSTVESTKKGLSDVGGTVKSTTEEAGQQIQGAGSAMQNAAKKSWHCISSFFTDC